MAKIRNDFDAYFDAWHQSLWRLCFVITRGRAPADELAFQTFLRLGAAKEPHLTRVQARRLLFERAVYLGTDYYIRKPHRLPKRETIQRGELCFPVTEGLYRLMKLPLSRRCALCLSAEGFTPEEMAGLLHVRPAKATRLCADPGIPNWREELLAVAYSDEDAQLLSDRIYERFAQRSVGVENAIHALRQGFDRVAPFLALAVLALFAFSLWYVSRL
ncbi:MAG: hypothetical protein ACI4MJ_07000 [Aristaeellaceae bacterium]